MSSSFGFVVKHIIMYSDVLSSNKFKLGEGLNEQFECE